MITALFAWFRALFTRRPAPAPQPAPVPRPTDPVMRAEIRRLTRKNRNQAARIRHLEQWHAAHRERIDALLSEIHDLTAKLGEIESDSSGLERAATALADGVWMLLAAHRSGEARPHELQHLLERLEPLAQAVAPRPAAQDTQPAPAPVIDDPDTWTPDMLSEYNHDEAERVEKMLADQHDTIHSLAEHIRQIAGVWECPDATGRTLAQAVTEAVGAADRADWENADGYDGTPFPPIPDTPAQTEPLRDLLHAFVTTYDDDAYSGTELLDALSPIVTRARWALGLPEPKQEFDIPALITLDPDPTDPVRDRDLTLTAHAPSMVTPDMTDWGANGTGEPESPRIETSAPTVPGQWRPLPAPPPHGCERGYIPPGGIL